MTDYINKIELPDGTMVKINDVPNGGTQSQVLTKISDADSDFGWTSIPQQDLSSYATKAEVTQISQSIPDISGLATSTELTSGLALKADVSSVPTKVSQLTNDANYLTSVPSEYVTESELNSKGYLTSHQDISGKADRATTLSGYGITDAYTKAEVDSMLGNIDTILDEILGA